MSLVNNYKVITVTHHDLNVNEIGNFYINQAHNRGIDQVIKKLKQVFKIEEIIYLETCNRVSYILYGDTPLGQDLLWAFFKIINPKLDQRLNSSIHKFVSVYEGELAIKHVFELASSMDSLVVGEREIFSQFRNAYNNCKSLGHTGDKLRILENVTVETAKKIYSQTKIGEKPLSVVSLAINTMLSVSGDKNSKILLIGSGETNTLVGKFLKKYGYTNVEIYNRSLNNASELAALLDAPSFHLNDLDKAHNFDTIIICTSANKVVLDYPQYQKMLNGDTRQKLLIDLAVPRNISEEIVEKSKVKYIDIESLKAKAEENLRFRKSELVKAKPIVNDQLRSFNKKIQLRQIEKALALLPSEVNSIKNKALNEIYHDRVNSLDVEARNLVFEMMDYMEKKCISTPMRLVKEV